MAGSLPEIFQATKNLSGVNEWTPGNNGRLVYVSPLEIGAVTVAGLQLRLTVLEDQPERAVVVQLEYPHSRSRRDYAVDRFDWRPLHDHTNHGQGPPQFIGQIIRQTHHHQFALNWQDDEAQMRKYNLPIAIPVNPEPKRFEELLEFASGIFRIRNLEIPIPPWQEKLL